MVISIRELEIRFKTEEKMKCEHGNLGAINIYKMEFKSRKVYRIVQWDSQYVC